MIVTAVPGARLRRSPQLSSNWDILDGSWSAVSGGRRGGDVLRRTSDYGILGKKYPPSLIVGASFAIRVIGVPHSPRSIVGFMHAELNQFELRLNTDLSLQCHIARRFEPFGLVSTFGLRLNTWYHIDITTTGNIFYNRLVGFIDTRMVIVKLNGQIVIETFAPIQTLTSTNDNNPDPYFYADLTYIGTSSPDFWNTMQAEYDDIVFWTDNPNSYIPYSLLDATTDSDYTITPPLPEISFSPGDCSVDAILPNATGMDEEWSYDYTRINTPIVNINNYLVADAPGMKDSYIIPTLSPSNVILTIMTIHYAQTTTLTLGVLAYLVIEGVRHLNPKYLDILGPHYTLRSWPIHPTRLDVWLPTDTIEIGQLTR